MGDRLRVEDAELELASTFDIDNLLRPIWKQKMIYITSMLWEEFTKFKLWFQNTMIPNFPKIIPFD